MMRHTPPLAAPAMPSLIIWWIAAVLVTGLELHCLQNAQPYIYIYMMCTTTHMGWALCSTSHGKPLRISQGFPKRLLVSTWWAEEMRAPLGGAGTTHHVYIIERLNNIMMFVLMIYLCVCGLSVLSPTAISLSLRFCLRYTWHLIFDFLYRFRTIWNTTKPFSF